jgi:hypothetical protein
MGEVDVAGALHGARQALHSLGLHISNSCRGLTSAATPIRGPISRDCFYTGMEPSVGNDYE